MTKESVTPDLFRGPSRRWISIMRERHPCVYMVASQFNGTLYIGVTSNLIGRVLQHRDGTVDGFTRRYGVDRLVWYEAIDRMDDAIASEKRMKGWRRDWKTNLIERTNPHWDDLATGLGLPPLMSRTCGSKDKPQNDKTSPTVDSGTSPA